MWELTRSFITLFKCRNGRVFYLLHQKIHRFIAIGIPVRQLLASCQLIQHQSKTPHIAIRVILLTLNSFRTHIDVSPHPSSRQSKRLLQLFANPEISNFHLPSIIHQYIFGLDIAVDLMVFFVDILQTW
jgi:hypothetical protein